MKGRLVGCLALFVAACATGPKPGPPIPASATVADLALQIAADSRRSDTEADSRIREALADDALRRALACLSRDSRAAACFYGQAIALGLQAKARPVGAIGLLNEMLQSLTSADAADPNYDQAGPSRVRALVLLRAPSWPLGPGDADAGLEFARRAVMLQPQFPPNLLALAEGLAKTDNGPAAMETYAQARKLAEAMPASADREDWLREADDGLRHR